MALFPSGSSPISSAPRAQQRRTWHLASTIGRTRASTIGLRIAICRFENGNEPCRATHHQEHCNGSSPCTPRPTIAFQFRPAAVPHKQFATIASKRSMHEKLRPASPKNSRAAVLSRPGKLNVTMPSLPMHHPLHANHTDWIEA